MDSEEISASTEAPVASEKERGLIYLSRIPTNMTVKKIRTVFSQYGDTDRIFLQPDERACARQRNRQFTEGWVEFLDKRRAKRVALALNNQQVGGKRKARSYEELWNIKYLSRFKWTHLNERLAYEREVRRLRLRTEISQAKKETAHYLSNLEKTKIQEKRKRRGKEVAEEGREWTFTQTLTEEERLRGAAEGERSPGGQRSPSQPSESKRRKRQAGGGETGPRQTQPETGPRQTQPATGPRQTQPATGPRQTQPQTARQRPRRPDDRKVGTDRNFLKTLFTMGVKSTATSGDTAS